MAKKTAGVNTQNLNDVKITFQESIQMITKDYYPIILKYWRKVEYFFNMIVETWPVNGPITIVILVMLIFVWWSYKLGKGNS